MSLVRKPWFVFPVWNVYVVMSDFQMLQNSLLCLIIGNPVMKLWDVTEYLVIEPFCNAGFGEYFEEDVLSL